MRKWTRGINMRRSKALEELLKDWADMVRRERHTTSASSGSWLASMVRWGGRAPAGLCQTDDWTQADDVNEAVLALERQEGGYIPAQVLRLEYLSSGLDRHERMRRLRRLGIQLDTTRYSRHLGMAKIHVAAWLHIPFGGLSRPDNEATDEAIAERLEFVLALDA